MDFTEWERGSLESCEQVNDMLWVMLSERDMAAVWKMHQGQVKNESMQTG